MSQVVNVPNVVSFVRLAAIPYFWWVTLGRDDIPLAAALIVAIGTTDWVDGYVARKTGQISKLGKLLDPVADRVAIIVVLLALVFRGVVPMPLAAIILVRDLIVSVIFPILEAKGVPRLPVNRTGKLATAFIFTGMGFAAASVLEPVADFSSAVSFALLAAGGVLYWIAGVLYLIELRKVAAAGLVP